jgi:hypothetical protein
LSYSNTTTFVFYNEIESLINSRKLSIAEEKLTKIRDNSPQWHYLYSKLLTSKAWFDSAKKHLEIALNYDPNNSTYKNELILFIKRYHNYSDGYYKSGYRKSMVAPVVVVMIVAVITILAVVT